MLPYLLPNAVDTVIAVFRRHLDVERALSRRSLYLVGSVAGDYSRPGASDVDFAAVMDAEPPDRVV
ncbi:hypothetical protein MFUR16E_17005 [Methylobacterium fujisawaense]